MNDDLIIEKVTLLKEKHIEDSNKRYIEEIPTNCCSLKFLIYTEVNFLWRFSGFFFHFGENFLLSLLLYGGGGSKLVLSIKQLFLRQIYLNT